MKDKWIDEQFEEYKALLEKTGLENTMREIRTGLQSSMSWFEEKDYYSAFRISGGVSKFLKYLNDKGLL